MFILAWLARHKLVVLAVVLLVAFAPMPVAALTNSEVIAIFNASIEGLLKLTKMAYCAAGVSPLC